MNIVPATGDDYASLAALYDRYAFALRRADWVEWKYARNPYGGTRSFKILHDDGRIVGTASLLPRVWHYQGRRFVAMQLVDGLMGEEIRGKRLFQELTGFLLRQQPVQGEAGHFYFTLPSVPASVKACAQAGLYPLASFEVFAYVLDPAALGRVRGLGWLPPLIGPLWRTAGGVARALAAGGATVEEVKRFDRDLTWLFPPERVHGDRSPEFLNWRVFDNPQDRLRAFFVHDRGEFAGYVIAKESGTSLEIMDLKFVAPRPRFLAAFLRHVADRRLAQTVSVGLLPGHPYGAFVRRAGFLPRGRGSGVFYVHHHREAGLPADPAAWDVNYIDSDW